MALKKRKFTKFRPQIRSRHPSHSILRFRNKTLPLLPFKSVIRLGSTTELKSGDERIELNSINAIKNSSNKLLMKQCFTSESVKTAIWWIYKGDENFELQTNGDAENELQHISELTFPIIAKSKFGSRGKGNYKLNNQEELNQWLEGKTTDRYIFEKFYNFNREYRLHVDKHGCFYTCRKMLKTDTPENSRWFRNDSNSVWILEENTSFDRPVNWDSIVEQCVTALKAVGLDFGAVDLRVQGSNNNNGERRSNPDFIVIEINSAPSFGTITAQKYIERLPTLLKEKYNEESSKTVIA